MAAVKLSLLNGQAERIGGAAPRHKIRRHRLSEELTAGHRKYIIDHDLKPGGTVTATIEGIGSLSNPVEEEPVG